MDTKTCAEELASAMTEIVEESVKGESLSERELEQSTYEPIRDFRWLVEAPSNPAFRSWLVKRVLFEEGRFVIEGRATLGGHSLIDDLQNATMVRLTFLDAMGTRMCQRQVQWDRGDSHMEMVLDYASSECTVERFVVRNPRYGNMVKL